MYVCICHGITDRQVRKAAQEGGANSAARVFSAFGCKPQCGKCVPCMRDVLRATQGERPRGAANDEGGEAAVPAMTVAAE